MRLPDIARKTMLGLFLSSMTFFVSGQTLTWTDSFVQGQAPTAAQCQNWSNFLSQLSGKNFASVTLSGTFDETGKTIADATVANALANLLSTGTPGTVYFGNEYWTVTTCGSGACGTPSIALSVNGNKSECDCFDTYAVRPHATNSNWGGVNTSSCSGVSQTMTLEFNSGISILASGPTSICQGGSVVLTASTAICSAPYSYLWSNGATTESITVTEPGSYSVTVTSSDGCSGTSSATAVSMSTVSVSAGDDVTICSDPVQLSATGASAGGTDVQVNKLCLYDAPGGSGNCTFTNDLCTEGAELLVNASYSQSITVANPVELRYLLYYSPYSFISTFNFKLNGQQIGSFVETNPTGTCTPANYGQYPRTIAFAREQFISYWNVGGDNLLTVEIIADQSGVYFAGIAAEVLTSNVSYSWSPAAGLTDAGIQNPIASPTETTTYTVTYTNGDGCTATDQVMVTVDCNTAPVAVCRPVTVEADANCEAIVGASAFDGGSTSPLGSPISFSVSPAGPYAVGETGITLTVTDSNGQSSTCTSTLTVTDTTPPSIAALSDIVVVNDAGSCSATVNLEAPQTSDNCEVDLISNDQTDNIFPGGETVVTWTVTDIHGNQQTATQKVTVTNDPPVINSVTASASTVATNAPVTLTVSYDDNNATTASIEWGDLSDPEEVAGPPNTFDVSHSYSAAGSYSVTVTINDMCDATVTYVYESIVVAEENQVGAVKGHGWFYSKPGYYLKNRRAAGKAQFEFEAENNNGGNVPEGSISFRFRAGKISFRSTQLESLLVDGQNAFLTGSGRLNGVNGYGILIGMVDEQSKNKSADSWFDKKIRRSGDHGKNPDRIRVKIWDADGIVVYDTQAASPDNAIATTDLGGGSIQVGSDFSEIFEDGVAASFEEGSTSVYPNPFQDWLSAHFTSGSNENINLQLMDLTGKLVFSQDYPVSEDGSYTLDLPEGKSAGGLYILKIRQGRSVEFLRVIRK